MCMCMCVYAYAHAQSLPLQPETLNRRLHGAAEALLTVTNLLIVKGFKDAMSTGIYYTVQY